MTDSIHVKSQTFEERKKESRETEEYLQQWAEVLKMHGDAATLQAASQMGKK